MANNLKTDTKKKQNESFIMAANPLLKAFSKDTERAKAGAGATYGGITVKTLYFLLMTVVGVVGYYLTQKLYFDKLEQIVIVKDEYTISFTSTELIFVGAALILSIVTAIIAAIFRKTTPVSGTIYTLAEGFTLGWIISRTLNGLEHIALEALIITIILVSVMAILYSTRVIKVTQKFRTVLTTLFITVIFTTIAGIILAFIPATSGLVAEFYDNPILSIVFTVIGIIVATMFLLTDFDTIEKTVKNRMPKRYEWSAAFGLAFTVIWIYLKVLDLLIELNNKK